MGSLPRANLGNMESKLEAENKTRPAAVQWPKMIGHQNYMRLLARIKVVFERAAEEVIWPGSRRH